MAFDKDRDKSFKSRAFIFLTVVVVILSTMALAVSIDITSTMLRKRDQLAAARSDATEIIKRNESGLSGFMNLKKAERWPLFFNGRLQEGPVCYASATGKYLLPFDTILDNLKSDYGIFNSDDAFMAVVNGKDLLLELGTRNAIVGGSPIELDTASVAAENQVLVSPGIMDFIEDFRFYNDDGNEAAFALYWPTSLNKEYSGIRLFKINGRELEISGVFGDKPMRYEANGPGTIDEAVYSRTLDSLLVRSGEDYFIINEKNYKKPARLGIEGSWSLSSDGSFLYRVDNSGRTFLIYDVKSSSLKRLKNHYSSVRLANGVRLTDCRLLAWKTGREYVRLDFEQPGGGAYTVIARDGRIVVQGSSTYSPDRTRLLLYGKTDGWSLCGSDGRGIVCLKDASTANWIDNDRILLKTDSGLQVYERKDGGRHRVEVPFYYIGKAGDGRLFFAKGNELYQDIGGKEKKLAEFPWRLDYTFSVDGKGPVVLISKEADAIFGFTGDAAIPLGKPGLFPNTPASGSEDAGFNSNGAFSPDGGRLALLQKGEKFLEINLLEVKDMKLYKLTLDHIPGVEPDSAEIFMKWLGNDSILLYTGNHGWLVDFDKDDAYIHEWSDKASIAGSFKLSR